MFLGFFAWERCSVRLRIRAYERLRLGFCKEADAHSFLPVFAFLLRADSNGNKYGHLCGTACSQYGCPDLHESDYLALNANLSLWECEVEVLLEQQL